MHLSLRFNVCRFTNMIEANFIILQTGFSPISLEITTIKETIKLLLEVQNNFKNFGLKK